MPTTTTNTWLTDVTTTLHKEADQLQQKLTTTRTQAKEIEANLKRLHAALSALEGKSPKKTRATKPPVTQAQISKAVTDALGDGRTLTKADIKERLDLVATKAGKSRVGLALRLDQALKADNIQQTDGKYHLATTSK